MATNVHVTACDNELYIIATTAAGSSEILHMTSGYNNPVNYLVTLDSVLPKGTYELDMIGINWGGPAAFTVTVGTHPPVTYSNPNAPVGVVWTQKVSVTVS